VLAKGAAPALRRWVPSASSVTISNSATETGNVARLRHRLLLTLKANPPTFLPATDSNRSSPACTSPSRKSRFVTVCACAPAMSYQSAPGDAHRQWPRDKICRRVTNSSADRHRFRFPFPIGSKGNGNGKHLLPCPHCVHSSPFVHPVGERHWDAPARRGIASASFDHVLDSDPVKRTRALLGSNPPRISRCKLTAMREGRCA
jgi:hypothetical protein